LEFLWICLSLHDTSWSRFSFHILGNVNFLSRGTLSSETLKRRKTPSARRRAHIRKHCSPLYLYALQSLLLAEFTTQSYNLFNVSVIKGWERRVTGKGEEKKRFSVFMVKHYSLIITCTFIKHCSFTIYFFQSGPCNFQNL
jgi:hypothetical protein